MLGWSLEEVLAATAGQSTSLSFSDEHVFEDISTDSRQMTQGSLFVPLVGAQHDGHDHVASALQQGAAAALWSRSGEAPAGVIRVGDTLQALQGLGAYHLHRRVKARVVAITGSTGKTTTKDLVACLLSTAYKIHKTPGNYNNDVGVPLTLLQLEMGTQVAVMEIAMRGLEQIRRLALLLKPEMGLITNVGVSHIELLGSREKIAQAKGELIEALDSEAVAVLPADSDFFAYLKGLHHGPVTSFSGDPDSSAAVKPLQRKQRGLEGWQLEFEAGHLWDFPLPGEHHVEDLAAAWAVAKHFHIDPARAGEALRQVRLSHLRMERHMLPNGLCLLNDAYNAAPDSMRSALKVLDYAPGRKLAVLGDMLELGAYEEQAHHELGQWVAEMGVDLLLAVGRRSQILARSAKQAGLAPVLWAPDTDAAAAMLTPQLSNGDTLLLKASRGVGLDRLVPELEKWQDDA
ncbi:MAG: UDP-N-acetylmuramoyl-tripeptide--D-alanyl-D-alanine ligase [Candidatus Eremiobacteraeota bacterium]|nr:UDP-N-acetylmuramoyl-tripeptide--D-alanyl-D-alanine ligase [Candidatus Eremiobacteraeota bacterium]MCW5870249.1 UDP-N-acetylmuramoyl-tripeptide--D-alanyl-D-alanine ligase [Candidatus Eremiobacteraeota bacterium]